MKRAFIFLLPLLIAGQEPRNPQEAEVFYRRAVMSQIDSHFSAMSAIVIGKLEHRRKDFKRHGASMILLLEESESLYSEERKKGRTRAKASVWREKEKFISMMQKSQSVVKTLIGASDLPFVDIKKHMKALKTSCLDCHKGYKLHAKSLEGLR